MMTQDNNTLACSDSNSKEFEEGSNFKLWDVMPIEKKGLIPRPSEIENSFADVAPRDFSAGDTVGGQLS